MDDERGDSVPARYAVLVQPLACTSPVTHHPLHTILSSPTRHRRGKRAADPLRKPCNCKNSRCLKLYCECFAAGSYCADCHCKNCHNNIEHDLERKAAVEAILGRNPDAFRPKIQDPV